MSRSLTTVLLLFTILSFVYCDYSNNDYYYNHTIVRDNDNLKNTSAFQQFMNGCHFDPTKTFVMYRIGIIVLDWFTATRICQAVFVFLVSLPFVFSIYGPETNLTTELVAKYAHFLLHGTSFLLRISLAMTLYPWLNAAFKQTSPCTVEIFNFDRSIQRTFNLGTTFAMPSANSITAALVGLQFAEFFSVIPGVMVMVLVPSSCVFVGINSVGQVISGFFIGFVIHFYHSRTPFWLRLIEFVVALFCGLLTLPLVKHFNLQTPFVSFGIDFFKAIVWQLFCFSLLFVLFSFGFLKIIIRKVIHHMESEDIQYLHMRLLPSKRLKEGEMEGEGDFTDRSRLVRDDPRKEQVLELNGDVFSRLVHYKFVVVTIAVSTFLILMAISVSEIFFDQLLAFDSRQVPVGPFL
ncbi:hypothetical protein AKO1_015725 [Acrasis kona]|uniref:Uncharacterized protein n=1 Tax=Acrasis kona TaxID=1008807 RepID=A0AAW2ZFF3_9EUKA